MTASTTIFDCTQPEDFLPVQTAPFAQQLDRKRPFWLMTANPQNSGRLQYRYLDTGELVEVPNIWYNQTLHVLLKAAQWKASELFKTMTRFEQGDVPGYSPQVSRAIAYNYKQTLDHMHAEIREIERRIEAGEQ
jgi:hypothetical protein